MKKTWNSILVGLLAFGCVSAHAKGTKNTVLLSDFAQMTVSTLKENGIANYIPVIVIVETQEIRGVQGIPEKVDHREAIQNYVTRKGFNKHEFFFGVKTSPSEVVVGHFKPGNSTAFSKIGFKGSNWIVTPNIKADWWKLK